MFRTCIALLLGVSVVACADGGDTDAAVDTGVSDSAVDTGSPDALPTDSGVADSAADAPGDVGVDGGSDAALDSGSDSGVDSGTDVGVDAGSGGWSAATLFVTATQYDGSSVGGVGGADDKCKMAAGAAALPNAAQYIAIISDSATDASERFAVTGEIRGTDGALLAASSVALWSSGVMTRVNRTETGGTVGWHLVWTGTQPTGIKHGITPSNFCQDWTSTTGGVETGRTDRSDDGWVAIYYPGGPGNACSNPGGIYCVGPR